MSFRDATVVIIETGRTVVRAGLGLHELLKTPSFNIPARVGLRKSASVNDVTAGTDSGASTSRASSLPQTSIPGASVNDYLVGSQLDEALAAGQDILISWPFADGSVRDWTQAEAIWKYVLFTGLQRKRVQNESPVLLSIPVGLSRDAYEKVCQIFFERFNVAGFGILERPMAQIYSTISLSGVVVDVDYDKSDITPIYEGFIVHPGTVTTSVGINDCQRYLANLLKSNQSVMAAISPPESPLESDALNSALLAFVEQIWKDGHIKIPSDGETAIVEDEGITDIAAIVVAGKEKAVIESGMKKKQSQKQSAEQQARAREIEAMDLITVQFKEKSITLGKERHRFCEPLFDPTLVGKVESSDTRTLHLSLQEAVDRAIRQTDVDQRQYIWQGVLVTGDLTKTVKGLAIALQSRLAPYVVNPELQTDVQPRSIRLLNVPEYYPEYRDTGEGYAAFLGSSIVAKLVFINDPHAKNFVSKGDYSQKGPHSIVEMSPALL
ncbi:hypothetical protein VKT23_014830 [Stygiomarasmius scandens]|uniref:Actin-related protein n=1 Tax=Marasmiellus scandens TaxID=2682957 RepID=A0ABR1IZL2_9AGAR